MHNQKIILENQRILRGAVPVRKIGKMDGKEK